MGSVQATIWTHGLISILICQSLVTFHVPLTLLSPNPSDSLLPNWLIPSESVIILISYSISFNDAKVKFVCGMKSHHDVVPVFFGFIPAAVPFCTSARLSYLVAPWAGSFLSSSMWYPACISPPVPLLILQVLAQSLLSETLQQSGSKQFLCYCHCHYRATYIETFSF